MRKERKVAGFPKMGVAVILAVLAVGLFAMQGGYLGQVGLNPLSSVGVPSVDTPQLDDNLQCPPGSPEDTTVTLSAVDKYTSVATGGSHRYKINGAPALTVANAGTFTASPGDTLEILWFNATSGAYLSDRSVEVIPCNAGTKTFSRELYANATVTVNVFNSAGNQIDGNTINETIGAGDAKALQGEISASNKAGFSHGGVVTVEYNDTEFDEVTLTSGTFGLSSRGGNPTVHKLTSVDNTAVSYNADALIGSGIKTFTVNYDADDTVNPGTTSDIVITWRPNNYFINEDTAGSFDGPAVEDEDRTATYGQLSVFSVHLI